MLRKINQSKKILYIAMGGIFLVALILNILTPMFVDDFTYLNSFATGERITNIWEIFDSMRAHYQVQNGRVIVHFFSQLFLLLPPIIFDIVNSVMFVMHIMLIYFYCKNGKKTNVLLMLVITAFIWISVRAFGQVYLWLSGACNYSWAAVFCLLYIFPYISLMQGKRTLKNKRSEILYIFVGVFVGALLESISFGSIIVGVCCIIFIKIYKKQKVRLWVFLSVVTQCMGYLFMMLSPASREYKVAKGGVITLLKNFLTILERYRDSALGLFVLWVVLIIVGIYLKMRKEILMGSAMSAILSVILAFIHIPAVFYGERCMLGSTLALIIAIGILLFAFWDTKYEMISTCVGLVAILLAIIEFFPGVADVASTYREYKNREAYIEEQKAKGVSELKLKAIWPETEYSAVWGLRDLEWDPNMRPNVSMALYYGVEEIQAIE